MKLRVIVWILVGLVVIAAAVFFVATSGKQPGAKKSLEDFKAQAVHTTQQLDRVVADAEQVRATAAGTPDREQRLAAAQKFVAESRTAIEKVNEAADVKTAEEHLNHAKQTLRKARREMQLASGVRRRRTY